MNLKIGILLFFLCGLAACDKNDCEETGGGHPIQQDCTDAILNYQETDVDCGGPSCGPCSNETCYLDYYVNGEFYQSNFISILLQGNETGSAITLSGGLAHSFALFLDSSTGDSLEIGDYEVEVGTAVVPSNRSHDAGVSFRLANFRFAFASLRCIP